MFDPEYKTIPVELIGELTTVLESSVKKIINARIDQSVTGVNYLVIPFAPPNERFAILVEIGDERLDVIKNRAMKLIYPFKHPEKKLFYLAELDAKDQIIKLAYIFPGQEKLDWPYFDNLDYDFQFIEKPKPFSLFDYSVERNRVAIEVIFESEDLMDNMKIWSFKNFLLPFTELLKTAILANSLGINPNNLEQKLKLGFSKIEHKCLRAILEFDYNPKLHEESRVLENLKNLYLLLDADDKEGVVKYVESFNNKKIVPDLIKILRAIIANTATFKTKLATPDEELKEIILNRSRSIKKKYIMESAVKNEPFIQTIIGILTKLDFDPKKAPLFSLHATSGDQKVCGVICPGLAKVMNEQTFNFINTEYKCEVEVKYTPETSLNKEKYEYTLLEITDTAPVIQTEINPDENIE